MKRDKLEFNKLIPELSVSDFEKSIKFYTDILGFRIEYEREESRFALLSFQGSQLMIEQTNSTWETGELQHPFGRGINLQITVDKISPILESIKKNKHPIFAEPKASWYRKDDLLLGSREFLVQDPDGYLLRFAEDIGTRKA